MDEPLTSFHQYSFATLRQYGACFELTETYCRWLAEEGEVGLSPSIQAFGAIADTAKRLQFQLARAMARGRDLRLDSIDRMGEQWAFGGNSLGELYT